MNYNYFPSHHATFYNGKGSWGGSGIFKADEPGDLGPEVPQWGPGAKPW